MNKLSDWSNISGSQKMSACKIEEFLFFYLVCKIHIKRSKKLETYGSTFGRLFFPVTLILYNRLISEKNVLLVCFFKIKSFVVYTILHYTH